MNKRGQFYLIAAIVIITVAVGFIIVSNSTTSAQTSNIYYLRDEIKIESSKVLDYAANNQLSEVQLTNNLTDLSIRYINNSQNSNFFFIFGNSTIMNLLAYETSYNNVTLNGVDYTNIIGIKIIYAKNFVPANNVTLTFNGNPFVFPVNSGQNFNFVLSNNLGGQNYTASS